MARRDCQGWLQVLVLTPGKINFCRACINLGPINKGQPWSIVERASTYEHKGKWITPGLSSESAFSVHLPESLHTSTKSCALSSIQSSTFVRPRGVDWPTLRFVAVWGCISLRRSASRLFKMVCKQQIVHERPVRRQDGEKAREVLCYAGVSQTLWAVSPHAGHARTQSSWVVPSFLGPQSLAHASSSSSAFQWQLRDSLPTLPSPQQFAQRQAACATNIPSKHCVYHQNNLPSSSLPFLKYERD